MPRNLLMVGTSNTIRRNGFAAVLRDMGVPFPVRAVGWGASPSALLPYMLSSTDLAGVTHLAIDPADNAQARRHGDGVSSAVLWHMVDWLRACGIVPILLLTPQTNIPHIVQAVRAARLEQARARGVAVVDGYRLIEGNPSLLDMEDIQHVGPTLSAAMMEALAAVVTQTAPTAILPIPPPFAAPLLQAPGAEVVERRSSTRVQRYTLLRPGHVARFSLPARGMLVGVALNIKGSDGPMRIASDEAEHVERLHGRPGPQDGRVFEFIHLVEQFAVSIPGRHFALRMEEDGVAEVEAAVCHFPPSAGPGSG